MPKLDPRYARLHKEVYQQFLDALDTAIVQEIMTNPSGEESNLLNQRVEAEIKRRIDEQQTLKG